MEKVAHHFDSVNVAAILVKSGYRIRGRRADCPRCSGHSRLTVSFTDDGRFYCHRCGKGGNVRGLARRLGVTLPPPRLRKADIPKAKFRAWLSSKMTELANEERRAYALKKWADAALHFYPEFELAWNFLGRFHIRHRVWGRFWESATDNIGRFHLYRGWRRHNRVH